VVRIDFVSFYCGKSHATSIQQKGQPACAAALFDRFRQTAAAAYFRPAM
jgi:hypothetical protein